MGWFLRKSFRLFPGVRINLSKSGPRVSVGVPGARASIDLKGKTRLYTGVGPIRYQKRISIGAAKANTNGSGLMELIKRMLGG